MSQPTDNNRNHAYIWQWTDQVRKHLQAGDTVEFSPKGLSMWPTLRPATDTVQVRSMPEYSRMDIVLAVSDNPRGVFLHRIIGCEAGNYILMGDANLYRTETCAAQAILGKVVRIRRNGKDVTSGTANKLLRMLHSSPPQLRRAMVRILNLMRK